MVSLWALFPMMWPYVPYTRKPILSPKVTGDPRSIYYFKIPANVTLILAASVVLVVSWHKELKGPAQLLLAFGICIYDS